MKRWNRPDVLALGLAAETRAGYAVGSRGDGEVLAAPGGDAVDSCDGGAVEAAAAAVEAAVERLNRAVSDADVLVTLPATRTALRATDRLHAGLVAMTATVDRHDMTASQGGLSTEAWLQLHAGQTRGDRRMLLQAADVADHLPSVMAAAVRGEVSWGALRAIVSEAARVTVDERGWLDRQLSQRLENGGTEDDLLDTLDVSMATLQADRTIRDRQRAERGEYLALTPRLDGSGSLFAEYGPERFATIAAAIDQAAPLNGPGLVGSLEPTDDDQGDDQNGPEGSDDPGDSDGAPRHGRWNSAGQRRAAGLAAICETFLGTDLPGAPAKPRLLATIDPTTLDHTATGGWAGRLLPSSRAGLTLLDLKLARRLACDADLTPILTLSNTPVGRAKTASVVPDRIRDLLNVRDGGCRFPGCDAPTAWTDAHHVTPCEQHGPTEPENLLLLCRRHHTLVHDHHWHIRLKPDGTATFKHPSGIWTTRPATTRATTPRARGRPPDPG